MNVQLTDPETASLLGGELDQMVAHNYADTLRTLTNEIIEKRGTTRKDLAEINPDRIYRFLRGETTRFDFNTGIRIMLRLGITTEHLAKDTALTATERLKMDIVSEILEMDQETLTFLNRWLSELKEGGRIAEVYQALDGAATKSDATLTVLRSLTEALAALQPLNDPKSDT